MILKCEPDLEPLHNYVKKLYSLDSGRESSQKCRAVPRRARTEVSKIDVALNSRLESNKEEEEGWESDLALGVVEVEKCVRVARPYLQSEMEKTPMNYELGFDQNYFTFALMLPINIVMCGEFP